MSSKDVVIVTGSEDVESLETVREIVHNPENHWPHSVSNIGFIRKEGKWVKFYE